VFTHAYKFSQFLHALNSSSLRYLVTRNVSDRVPRTNACKYKPTKGPIGYENTNVYTTT